MIQLGFLLTFSGLVIAHSGLKAITVDGIVYPPYDSRIDNLIGPAVRRIEWSHDVPLLPWMPIFNASSPSIACQSNAKPPLLKAPIRAGATVQFNWTEIVKMHFGPALAYLGEFNPIPQEIKFFKIYEKGYDVAKGKWANEIASENGDTYTVQIPSDIKAGTYTLRTELIALHGQAEQMATGPLAGPQFYTYCINIDVIGGGNVRPEGVRFPGGYTKESLAPGIYLPYKGESAEVIAKGKELNSKYVLPGPPLYRGRYDAPTGSPPTVAETGAYTGELKVKYDSMLKKLAAASRKMINYVNTQVFQNGQMDAVGGAGFPAQVGGMLAERAKILNTTEFIDLKKAIESQL